MSSTTSLVAAAEERKARLAQLKSLKRKQPTATPESVENTRDDLHTVDKGRSVSPSISGTSKYLSGRNYDSETRGPKLGFETQPAEGEDTVEAQAEAIEEATRAQIEEEEKADKPLDLFKLQPKKPNWDLKRDLDRKLQILNVRTDNAIARLVRERILAAQNTAEAVQGKNGDAEPVGLDGVSLVEATHVLEREEAEDERRERQEEEAEDGFS